MTSHPFSMFGAALAVISLSACEPKPVDGGEVYQAECATCHGVDARGGGELAPLLPKAPPDLTTIAFRNGGVFDRDRVMSTIDGYHRPDSFAMDMPEFGAGDMGQIINVDGTPVPARLLAVTFYLESLQRAPE